ncbi:MAG: ABC transporter substrate-binding protein [Clostridia bacterium]|nr:ABC transporter substrate-binding protein [Clostridia bacterium]
MKKLLAVILAVVLALSVTTLVACQPTADINVGILQVATHTALDGARQGFKEVVQAWADEVGKTVAFHEQNANGDPNNETTLAQTLVAQNHDLLLGIATSSAQALYSNTQSIPVLYTAVTNPAVDLAGLGTIQGVSDMNPVAQQIQLVKTVVEAMHPEKETIKLAFVFNGSETNSLEQVNLAKAECARLGGFTTVDVTASSSNDIATALASNQMQAVDCIYVPTDNLMAENMNIIYAYSTPNNIPVICGESGMCDAGEGTATFGIDYYLLGQQVGEMAIEILEGKTLDNPNQFYTRQCEFFINEENALAMGMTQTQIDQIKDAFQGE